MSGYWRRCYGGRVIHCFARGVGVDKTLCGKTLIPRVVGEDGWEKRYPKCKKCAKLLEEAECTTTNSEP